MAATSWPSITIGSQPNAFTRAAYASTFHSSSVGPRWPSRLMSKIAVKFDRPSWPAWSRPSQIEPSASSLSPVRVHTWNGAFSGRFAASASPTAMGRPWPSDPVATSVHGRIGRGVPFEAAAHLAEGHELGVVDRAGRPEHRVVER